MQRGFVFKIKNCYHAVTFYCFNMRTKLPTILIGTGVLIGFLLISQIGSGVPKQSNFPLDQLQAKESLIKDYLDEQNELKSRITTLRE